MESPRPLWLLISTVWPEPQSSAAGLRDLNLVQGLVRLGFDVVLASAADNPKGLEFCRGLERRGEVRILSIRLNHSSFDDSLRELVQAGLCGVIYDRFLMEEQYGPRVREHCPQALQVVDTQDLHFLRNARKRDPKLWEEGMEETEVVRELSSLHRVDLAWLVSPFEKELLESRFSVASRRLSVSRFAYPKRPETFRGFSDRVGFSFIGNFRHPPNLDAFRWLRREIWPEVRRLLPGARIDLWGAYPPQEVSEAHDPKQGFFVRGCAPDLEAVFSSSRVSLAPLRFGAGIKGKISDSWHYGVPVVATSIGFEGMTEGEGAAGGLSGEGTLEFAQAAVSLHEDQALWERLRSQGLELIERFFSEQVFLDQLQQGLSQARQNFLERDNDWVRRMLTHHSLETPRFFGKWLELKESIRHSRP